jgi:hypothetical protein
MNLEILNRMAHSQSAAAGKAAQAQHIEKLVGEISAVRRPAP